MAVFRSRKVFYIILFIFYTYDHLFFNLWDMGSDTWNKSEKKLRNINGTKIMFWYKWLEQSSPVPGKGVGSGGKTYKQIIS